MLSLLINCTWYCSGDAYNYGSKIAGRKEIKFRRKIYLQQVVASFKPLLPKGLYWFISDKAQVCFSVFFYILLHNGYIILIFMQHVENGERQFYKSLAASCCPPNNEVSLSERIHITVFSIRIFAEGFTLFCYLNTFMNSYYSLWL